MDTGKVYWNNPMHALRPLDLVWSFLASLETVRECTYQMGFGVPSLWILFTLLRLLMSSWENNERSTTYDVVLQRQKGFFGFQRQK